MIIAVAGVLFLLTGAYCLFLRDSRPVYSGDGLILEVNSFKCGERTRTVVQGPYGSAEYSRPMTAIGAWCILDVSVSLDTLQPGTSAGALYFSVSNQDLIDSSGMLIHPNAIYMETIIQPDNYHQPVSEPVEIEPGEIVEVRLAWDYDPASQPGAAVLRAEFPSRGVEIPYKG